MGMGDTVLTTLCTDSSSNNSIVKELDWESIRSSSELTWNLVHFNLDLLKENRKCHQYFVILSQENIFIDIQSLDTPQSTKHFFNTKTT